MRITRITKIRGHRVFRHFTWPSDLHSFDRFNLIYGWNGCGKTTLSSLFRHLETRTNLTEGEIEFEIDETRKCPGTAIISTHLPLVRVFNDDFKKATIDTAGTRVEPIYYLGEDSIAKQAKADELKQKKDAALDELTKATSVKKAADGEVDRFSINQAKVIKEVLTGAQSPQYNNYDKRRFKESMAAMQGQADAKAALLTDEAKEQLRKQKDSQPKPDLPVVTFVPPDFVKFANDAKKLLERAVASETLDALAQDKVLARWVQQGLDLHSGDRETSTCHFCLQPLTIERRTALEGHFNDAFATFQHEISSAMTSLDQQVANLNRITFPDAAHVYDHLQNELDMATSDARRATNVAAEWLTDVSNALEVKKSAPFGPLQPSGWQDHVPTAASVRDAIDAVNTVVAKHNNITNNFRNEVNEACKKLEQNYVAEAWDDHTGLVAAVTAANSAITPLQNEIDDLKKEIADIERDILEHRRPADELNEELRAYLGRDELRFDLKGTGYALTRAGEPVTHLSEGEKTAIAFLYFLKTLQDREFDLTNGVVVIDDPVSSLDANALFSAFGYMKERTKECGQLFIFTHSFSFFRLVKNWFHHLPGQRKKKVDLRPGRFFLLQARRHADGTRTGELAPLDRLLEEHESEYQYLFRRVYDEAHRNDVCSLEHHYGLPNVARRLVEAFLAFRFPDLGGDLSPRFDRVSFDNAKKTRILRLLNTYSHAGAISDPEHDLSLLAETQPVLLDLLEMMKSVDPEHYAGLEKLVRGAGEA